MIGGALKLVGFAALMVILLIVGWVAGVIAFPWPFA